MVTMFSSSLFLNLYSETNSQISSITVLEVGLWEVISSQDGAPTNGISTHIKESPYTLYNMETQ